MFNNELVKYGLMADFPLMPITLVTAGEAAAPAGWDPSFICDF